MTDLPRVTRGEVWDVEWDPGRGSEQAGTRPSLVIQTDAINRSKHYTNTIVAAITTQHRDVPTEVAISPSRANGLSRDSWVKCEQLLTISKERLVGKRPRGRLSDADLRRVDDTLRDTLGL